MKICKECKSYLETFKMRKEEKQIGFFKYTFLMPELYNACSFNSEKVVDVVTGQVSYNELEECKNCRDKKGHCGVEARHYEESK
jgi:hypothetical protein